MNTYKCCLLLEDDPDDQEFFIDALHEATTTIGCYVVTNGEEALHALIQEDVNPEFIFTDIQMPRMDGFEFLKIIKSLDAFKHIPVIVYSSNYSDAEIQKAKKLGAQFIYSKNRLNRLSEILKKILDETG